MPLFDYVCADCGATSEMLVRSAETKVRCPECGGGRMKRQPAAFAVGSTAKTPLDSRTCCGADEPCESRPCAADGVCRRDV